MVLLLRKAGASSTGKKKYSIQPAAALLTAEGASLARIITIRRNRLPNRLFNPSGAVKFYHEEMSEQKKA